MNEVLNVLCLEDSQRDAEIMHELLKDAGYDVNMDRTEVEKEFVSLLRSHKYDIILADFKLPGFDGFAALRWSVEICPNVPFICVSGTIGEETAVELLKQGASDYVLKDRMARLPFAIQRALQEVKEKQLLNKSEEKFRSLVENSPTGIFITNLQGDLLFANIAFCKMLEFDSFEEFKDYGVGRTYWNQEDRAVFIGQLRKSKRLTNYELVLKTGKGNPINIILSAYLEEDRITGTVIDITERKRAEEALLKSEARYRSYIDVTGQIGWVTNADGEVVEDIPSMRKFSGQTYEETKGSGWAKALHPDDLERTVQAWNKAVATKSFYEVEYRMLRHDGVYRYLLARGFPVFREDGSIREWVGTCIDITERKRAEKAFKEALVKAESADRLKTVFIHNISHELRTPLNGILGFSSLITQQDLTSEEKEYFSSIIKLSSNRLLNTITNYMDISMIVSGNIEVTQKPFDLHQILHTLREQFQPICDVKKLDLNMKIPNETGTFTLHSDGELFSKALSHLLDNAVKFTPQGKIAFGYTIKPGLLEFFVKDTGLGINKVDQNRIFENFAQEDISDKRGSEGSGLGLSIAQGLVKLLGGEIRVESEKGVGSTFFFTIPYEATWTGVPALKEAGNEIPLMERPVILVAEDDESNSLYLETILKKTAVTVLSAINGKEAVRICHDHPEISLVLMDMKMPVMDGTEATREIKSFRKDLPVIAITAFAMSGDEKRVLEAGCDDYLAKPFSKDVLLKKLKRYGIAN